MHLSPQTWDKEIDLLFIKRFRIAEVHQLHTHFLSGTMIRIIQIAPFHYIQYILSQNTLHPVVPSRKQFPETGSVQTGNFDSHCSFARPLTLYHLERTRNCGEYSDLLVYCSNWNTRTEDSLQCLPKIYTKLLHIFDIFVGPAYYVEKVLYCVQLKYNMYCIFN